MVLVHRHKQYSLTTTWMNFAEGNTFVESALSTPTLFCPSFITFGQNYNLHHDSDTVPEKMYLPVPMGNNSSQYITNILEPLQNSIWSLNNFKVHFNKRINKNISNKYVFWVRWFFYTRVVIKRSHFAIPRYNWLNKLSLWFKCITRRQRQTRNLRRFRWQNGSIYYHID